MGLNIVEKRTEPKEEISHEVPKHNRVFTGPTSRGLTITRTPEEAAKAYFAEAQQNLAKWNFADTLAQLEKMSTSDLEMYLLAEEVGRNRPEVLRSFPRPGARARARYLKRSRKSRTTAVGA